MKKIVTGIIIGVALGGTSAWLLLRHPNKAVPEAIPEKVEKAQAGLHLTKEQQEVAGLVIGEPEAVELPAEVKGFGRVLDVTPLATLLAEMEAADSAAAASEKEWARLRSLGDNAAARTLEAAEAAMKRDRAASESAHGRLVAHWSKALANRADLPSLTRSLLARELALARVDIPAGEALESAPTGVRVVPATVDGPFQPTELIGPAPSADPQAQGQALLVLIHGSAPAPGTALTARLACAGPTQKGFRLPRTAVVQRESEMFIYVQTGDETFERRRVETGPPLREDVCLSRGVSGNDRVVLIGAQQLLSEELKGLGGDE